MTQAAPYQVPARGARVAALFPHDVALLPEVQSFLTLFKDLILEGRHGVAQQEEVIESVPMSLFICHAMISSPTIYRTVLKALSQSAVETSVTVLGLPGNDPLVHKCVMAIWGAAAAKDIVAKCIRTQKTINSLLSSPSHISSQGQCLYPVARQ